jgi:hypothetical protein
MTIEIERTDDGSHLVILEHDGAELTLAVHESNEFLAYALKRPDGCPFTASGSVCHASGLAAVLRVLMAPEQEDPPLAPHPGGEVAP